jgi:hypothetical protein
MSSQSLRLDGVHGQKVRKPRRVPMVLCVKLTAEMPTCQVWRQARVFSDAASPFLEPEGPGQVLGS